MSLLISSACVVNLFIKRERVSNILTHFINKSYLEETPQATKEFWAPNDTQAEEMKVWQSESCSVLAAHEYGCQLAFIFSAYAMSPDVVHGALRI